MNLKRGDRVRHPRCPDWGVGEVLEDSNGATAKVFFVGGDEKTISLKHVKLMKLEGDEAADPRLDNFHRPKGKYLALPRAISMFEELYPGGFYGGRFDDEERRYKIQAHQRTLELLSEEELRRLNGEKQFDEVVRRAMQVMNATNLVFPNEKMAFRDGLVPPLAREQFAVQLLNVLYGTDDLKSRFEAYSAFLEEIQAGKWTIASYFLFFRFPEEHMFIKPTVTQLAADLSAFQINYRPNLNWATYASVLQFAKTLKNELVERDLRPRDMIDVQSFMWAIAPHG